MLVSNFIEFEYSCLKNNTGMLVRGSGPYTGEKNILRENLLDSASVLMAAEKTMWGASDAFSVSYGNSLFAGLLMDRGACAFNHGIGKTTTYCLTINKKDQIENMSDFLFYIAPLSTLEGLLGCGEEFHSRTLAASDKDRSLINVGGITNRGKAFLVSCADFKQELLFQEYFLTHAHFIHSEQNPTIFLRACKAAITAMKAIWEEEHKKEFIKTAASKKIQALARQRQAKKEATTMKLAQTNKDNWTPLHIAVRSKNIVLIRKLLRNGANVNTKASTGVTPLHTAVALRGKNDSERKKIRDIVAALLEKNADANALTNHKWTPLKAHYMVGRNTSDPLLVELLKAHSAHE